MSVLEKLNVGIVGAVGRGRSFTTGFEANGARVHANCNRQACLSELCECGRPRVPSCSATPWPI